MLECPVIQSVNLFIALEQLSLSNGMSPTTLTRIEQLTQTAWSQVTKEMLDYIPRDCGMARLLPNICITIGGRDYAHKWFVRHFLPVYIVPEEKYRYRLMSV